MAVNSLNMLPLYLLENKTFKDLLKAEDIEINVFESYINEIRKELNITTADKLISRYEKIFDIKPVGTKRERVFKILSKLNTNGTCRVSDIETIVRFLTKRDGKVIEHFNDYSFDVLVQLFFDDETSIISSLKEQIEELRPCHLAYRIIMLLEIIIFKNLFDIKLKSLKISLTNNNFGGKNHYLNGFYQLNGTYTLEQNFGKEIISKSLLLKLKEVNVVNTEVFLIASTMWKLDGSYNLGGIKNINAYRKREAI